jgi:uracil-DNA glycosylase family 4
MDKSAELKKLEEEMAADISLSLREANLVFGEGNPDCEVMFIGEAPGFHEDRLKRPFVGRAGQLLDDLIREIGWKRENVYITNVVKRRPPENRDPSLEEIDAYGPYLTKQIEIINPKVIAAVGRFAMNYFLPEAKITRDHGKVFKVDGRLVVPLFHTAAALRSSEMMKQLREDFKRLPDIVAGRSQVEEVLVKFSEGKKKKPPQPKLF